MKIDGKTLTKVFAVAAAVVLCSFTVSAQPGQRGRPGRPGGLESGDEVVAPAEVQRMFDAYALMQAQEQLNISDDQFARFLTRYKALQDVRRRTLQERVRIVMELRRILTGKQQGDDALIRDHLKSLDDLDGRTAADVRKAYEAIDQILDVRQQARFRVFEENVERRKLDLVTRARQAKRPTP